MHNQQRLWPFPVGNATAWIVKAQRLKISTPPRATVSHWCQMCWSLPVALPNISPRFHVSSLSWASLLPCPLNQLIQFYVLCINVQVWSAIQEIMYSWLQMCSLSSTALLRTWILLRLFSLLLSPSSKGPGAPHSPPLYCLGFPYHDNYCLKEQEKSQCSKVVFIELTVAS